jgi:sugar phosphate isomerase/epimerase
MLLDRRSFLRTATVPLLAPNVVALAQQRLTSVGLQLFTVRAELQKDFDETLARVAAIGYKEVEFAGYFGRSPADVRAALRANGLTGISSHVGFNTLGDRWPDVVEAARTVGHEHLVVASVDDVSRTQPNIWPRVAEQFNRAGEVCNAAGIRLAYHNHMFEFASLAGTAKRPYEIILESTDSSLVSLQMDLCWIVAAGQDPSIYFQRYPGRFVSVHVKDLKRVPQPPSRAGDVPDRAAVVPDLADVGQGVLDWNTILPQCWSAGIRRYFVEHDRSSDSLASAARSYQYLDRLRFDATR